MFSLSLKIGSWAIVIFTAIICGLIFILRNRKIIEDFKIQRQLNFSLSSLCFCFAANRFLFILCDIERFYHGESLQHTYFWLSGYLFSIIGFLVCIYYYDKNSDKSSNRSFKFIPTKIVFGFWIICIMFLFLLFVSPEMPSIVRNIYSIGLYCIAGVFSLSILRVLKGVILKNFKKFIWGFLGFILILIGVSLDSGSLHETVYKENPLLLTISAIFVFFGFLLLLKNSNILFKLFHQYYASKQICLVHRGKIEGKILFCPNCFVQYCKKCFNFINSSEHQCWACKYNFEIGSELNEDISIDTIEDELKEDITIDTIEDEIHKGK